MLARHCRSPGSPSTTSPRSSSAATAASSTSSRCTASQICAAAGDDGSRQQRLAQGLLAEASTTVIYRQHAQEVPDTAEALGLSTTARERIARLPPGVALWCVGGRCFEVRHLLSDREWALIDTDQAMGARRQTTPPESDDPELGTAAAGAP